MKQHQTPKLKYRNLGSSGLKVSELCLGTMTFGPSSFKMPYADEETSFKMMDRFAEFGGNFLDLADFYGPFESEKIVGKWLSTKKREDFVLATKTYLPLGHGPNDKGASRKHIVAALEGTLERLKTSYVDLHCVAIWDNSTSLKETLTTLNDLVRCGKVRYIGASNLGGWQLQKMLDLAKEMGLEQYISLQQQYSLLERHSEGDAFEVCKREGLGILPWGALKSGLLSGQYTSSTDVAAASANPTSRVGWAANSKMPLFNLHGDDHTWNVIKKVEEISKQIDKTVPQVALRWLLHKPQVSSIIIGAKTLEQLEDNLQAGLFQLTEEQVAELDHVSAVPLRYPYSMIAFANASVHHH